MNLSPFSWLDFLRHYIGPIHYIKDPSVIFVSFCYTLIFLILPYLIYIIFINKLGFYLYFLFSLSLIYRSILIYVVRVIDLCLTCL